MSLTIVHLTNRKQACHQWFADSLCRQAEGKIDFDVVFVDSIIWSEGQVRRDEVSAVVAGRFPFRHSPPKPTVWQGPTRLTKEDWFAASNARNTGFCLASGDYIMFVDDLSVLLPGWLNNVRHAAQHRYIVGGCYKKVEELTIENGEIKHFKEIAGGTDCRMWRGTAKGITQMNPGELYGCSFGVPLEAVLQTNGQDEIYDGGGYEDTALGFCLANNGWRDKMFYNINIGTLEDGPLHGQGKPARREDFGTHPNNCSHALSYGKITCPSGRRFPGAFNQDGAYRRAVGNNFNIDELRQSVLNGGSFPVPTEPSRHYWDNRLLSDL